MNRPSSKTPATLVLDDNALWRQIVRSIVESISGISPFVASNGNEAIDVLKTRHICVAVCDLNMPEMNGLQFLEHARRISPKTKVIIMSGDLGGGDTILAQELMDRGAFAVTSKTEILPNLSKVFATLKPKK
jgi:CheY-like chemotaxis protein